MCRDHAGTPDEHYSLLTDNEHSLNAQFVKRSQRLNEDTQEWFNLPTLEDKATWLGALGLTFKDDTAQVSRAETGEIIGKGLLLPHNLQETSADQHMPSGQSV